MHVKQGTGTMYRCIIVVPVHRNKMASNFAKQLLKAAQTDDDDSLKRLINIINKAKDGNKDILHSLHRSGDGILHIAARFGNVKILKLRAERIQNSNVIYNGHAVIQKIM